MQQPLETKLLEFKTTAGFDRRAELGRLALEIAASIHARKRRRIIFGILAGLAGVNIRTVYEWIAYARAQRAQHRPDPPTERTG